jgi:hypothetical protein
MRTKSNSGTEFTKIYHALEPLHTALSIITARVEAGETPDALNDLEEYLDDVRQWIFDLGTGRANIDHPPKIPAAIACVLPAKSAAT